MSETSHEEVQGKSQEAAHCAKVLVGAATDDDTLDPEATATSLPQGSHLRAILENEGVVAIHRRRQEASARSRNWRRWYRGLGKATIAGSALVALASGLLLTGSGHAGQGPIDSAVRAFAAGNRLAIQAAQVAGVLLTTFASVLLGLRGYSKRWTNERGAAENGRILLFEKVFEIARKNCEAGPASPFAQAFEYFRRYQLELQERYQTRRLRTLDLYDGRGAVLVAVLTAVASVGSLVVVFGAGWALTGALLGVLLPVLLSATESWRRIDGNAVLDSVETVTIRLREELDRVGEMRELAAVGRIDEVMAYVSRVHDIMRIESGAWAGRLSSKAGDRTKGIAEQVDRKPQA